MKKDLLTLLDLTPNTLEQLLKRALVLKKERKRGHLLYRLRGKTLAMLFEKSSTRTRVSFEIAMRELGGGTVSLERGSSQIGRGESYGDTARVLSGYAHGILIRTFGHSIAEEVAREASIPVINGLTDLAHPCQLLADLLTVREYKKGKAKVAYVGDGNNMANSWIHAAQRLQFPLAIATPKGYEPAAEVIEKIPGRSTIVLTNDPIEAVRGADVVNTDTWFSMGQEVTEEKREVFRPFQLNSTLLNHANKDAIVLHCLPAHRGEEITDEVMDGPQSRIWQQAENRLHVQKAILEMLL
ncbi:MAG: ornithine carbamoyltransferase [Deltaproteobacteria bacterium]|nr:ornithine carbamoyltransferase [Deltaproteobacteria bacterium]